MLVSIPITSLPMNLLVKPVTIFLGVALILIGLSSYSLSGEITLSMFHVLTGLMALYAFSTSQLLSYRTLLITGVVYALITVLGFFFVRDIAGVVSVTAFDNYTHLIISAVCLIVGFGSRT